RLDLPGVRARASECNEKVGIRTETRYQIARLTLESPRVRQSRKLGGERNGTDRRRVVAVPARVQQRPAGETPVSHEPRRAGAEPDIFRGTDLVARTRHIPDAHFVERAIKPALEVE